MTASEGTALECPVWCRTDHAAEAALQAERNAETDRYIVEQAEELRRVLGPRPALSPVEDSAVFDLLPVHVHEVGEVDRLRVRVEQYGHDGTEGPRVVIDDSDLGEPDLSAEQARSVAALLVQAADLLDAAQ